MSNKHNMVVQIRIVTKTNKGLPTCSKLRGDDNHELKKDLKTKIPKNCFY